MRGTYLRVGVLLLLGLGLAVGAVLFFGGSSIRHGKTYETYFRDSVQGLDVGAAVKYRGVAVGSVTAIGLSSAEYGQDIPDSTLHTSLRTVYVRFEVDLRRMGTAPGPAEIKEGFRARIAPQGLTGQSYLELDFFNPERYPPLAVPWTPRYDYIPSIPSTLSQVQESAVSLLRKFQEVDVAALADGLQGLVADLRSALRDGDAHTLIVQATATLRALEVAVTKSDLPAVTAELRQTLAAARTLAQGPQTQDLLRSAKVTTDRLAQAAARLPALMTQLDAVLRRADSGSADLEAGLVPILRDARAAVSALRQTSDLLRRDPGQVVLGAPPPRSSDK